MTLSIMTLSIMTLSRMTLSIMILIVMTFIKNILSIMALSRTMKTETLCVNCCYAQSHYVDCHYNNKTCCLNGVRFLSDLLLSK